jgi:xanthine/CO dehydrogenase XdhC/CoxF family maturation factor
MLQDLKADGVEITDDAIEKLYGPIGLEIGAETPEEIAISIIAEILAALRKKPGGYLRTKATTIHQSTTNISVNDVV